MKKIIKISIITVTLAALAELAPLPAFPLREVSASDTPGSSLTSGLVGYWTFDGKDMLNGKALDKSGNNNTGTLVNIATSTFYKAGKIGQALNFDGVNDYVNVPNNVNLNFGTNNFSVGVWIYPKQNGTLQNVVSKRYSQYSGYAGWNIKQQTSGTGDWAFEIADTVSTPNETRVTFGATLTLNRWHYLVGVANRSSNRIRAYLDGVQIGSGTDVTALTGSVTDTNYALQIGKFADGTYPFNGLIDDVRIYNRALSATEVKQLYNLGR